jgi:uncharacterized protein with von Willebrand factor type A (vWA) domain
MEFDAAMTASDLQRLRQADFNQLSASEYLLVERLARDIGLAPAALCIPPHLRPGVRGSRPHWPGAMHHAARNGGECCACHAAAAQQPVPLLVLVDVSGSMERYARLLLAFLHAATAPRHTGAALRRDVFAFGTGPDRPHARLSAGDTDAMLQRASHAITDYAGGTRMGEALANCACTMPGGWWGGARWCC